MQRDQQVGGRVLGVVGVDADDVDASDRSEKALPARRGVPVAVVGGGERRRDDPDARQRDRGTFLLRVAGFVPGAAGRAHPTHRSMMARRRADDGR